MVRCRTQATTERPKGLGLLGIERDQPEALVADELGPVGADLGRQPGDALVVPGARAERVGVDDAQHEARR